MTDPDFLARLPLLLYGAFFVLMLDTCQPGTFSEKYVERFIPCDIWIKHKKYWGILMILLVGAIGGAGALADQAMLYPAAVISLPAIIFMSAAISFMAIEDALFETVDMEAVAILAGLAYAASPSTFLEYLINVSASWLIFRTVFLLSIKISPVPLVPEAILPNLAERSAEPRIRTGYLPALYASLLIYYTANMASSGRFPYEVLADIFIGLSMISDEIARGNNIIVIAAAVFFAVYLMLEARYHRALSRQHPISYGFGSGDVFVLSAIGGFTGVPVLMIIFFISLIMHLPLYAASYIEREVKK